MDTKAFSFFGFEKHRLCIAPVQSGKEDIEWLVSYHDRICQATTFNGKAQGVPR